MAAGTAVQEPSCTFTRAGVGHVEVGSKRILATILSRLAANPGDLISQLTAEYARASPGDIAQFRNREISAATADAECGRTLRHLEGEIRRGLLAELSPEDFDAIFHND